MSDHAPDLGTLTTRQYGLVSARQLRDLHISRKTLEGLEATKILQRVRFGVYRSLGAQESWHMMAMGAVLAAGAGAVLSHRSAAILWGLRDPRAEPPDAPLELTCARRLRLDGVTAHRHRLAAGETTTRKRIPVTTVERTLLDMAEFTPAKELGQAMDDAIRRRLTTAAKLHATLQAHEGPGRRRRANMRRALAERGVGYDPGANDWEQAMDRRWDEMGLPPAERQYRVRIKKSRRTYKLDRAIVDLKIGVEWCGRHHHGTRSDFVYDSNRRNDLIQEGWQILDFTPASSAIKIRETVLSACRQRALLLLSA
ncbi:MAG TPA: type IV toxin-antitoxin system AbiEi family antitoxin domain-containing protein [Acidimicrobiales bacterium]|nr:type IV toxin-antitoxin system AbiEi family antitoxin domain-containing protein [Acidimicrobiales bacterium]